MADNPGIDPGTSPTVLVEGDDIGGGVIRQAVVIAYGAKDASGRVAANNPLPTAEGQVLVDNAGFTDGTSKVFPSGYIYDEAAGTALTENDVAAARVDAKRGQVAVLEDATTRGQRAAVSAAGALSTQEARATTGAAPTPFTATASTQVFASNAARKLFTVYNNSNVDLYLMLASAVVSVTSYHVKVPANGGYFATSDYSGEIRGILSAAIATGQINPGEFT